jgi:hypothetical protein
MGTNYYVLDHRTCTCGDHHRIVTKHVGKSIAGRKFLFSTEIAKDIRSVLFFVQDPAIVIEDEYGTQIKFRDFLDMMLGKQTMETNARESYQGESRVYADQYGFEFMTGFFN